MKWLKLSAAAVALVLVVVGVMNARRPPAPMPVVSEFPAALRASDAFMSNSVTLVFNTNLGFEETCRAFDADPRWKRRMKSTVNAHFDHVGPGPIKWVGLLPGRARLEPPGGASAPADFMREAVKIIRKPKPCAIVDALLEPTHPTAIKTVATVPSRGSSTWIQEG